MKELKFRAWHIKENKMYYRGYQKFFHALLCEKDPQDQDGAGKPVRRVPYGDCFLLESTGLEDKAGREIFEGDIVRVLCRLPDRQAGDKVFTGRVGSVPDMFGSRKLHPLQALLKENGINGNPDNLEIEVLGNEYENPEILNN